MSPPEILLERAEAVAIVTLNRPDRMNAVHLPMMIALADMLADLEGDETVGALVLTGAGRGFCAGGGVTHMAARGPPGFEGRVAATQQIPLVPAPIRAMPTLGAAAAHGARSHAGRVRDEGVTLSSC